MGLTPEEERAIFAGTYRPRAHPARAVKQPPRVSEDLLISVMEQMGAKILALQERIAVLEQRPQVKYCGTWREVGLYCEGSLATHAGGLWIACGSTHRRPGDGDDWRLIVKSGGAVDKRK